MLIQHGETAIHLVAKYNHANVVAAYASFKVNVNIVGKVYIKEVIKPLMCALCHAGIVTLKISHNSDHLFKNFDELAEVYAPGSLPFPSLAHMLSM